MARYVDADKLAEYITTNYCKNCDIHDGEKCNTCPMNDSLNYIETFPTADVVPKSEVVREIFEEIETALDTFDGSWANTVINTQYLIAELKKKYTEGNND